MKRRPRQPAALVSAPTTSSPSLEWLTTLAKRLVNHGALCEKAAQFLQSGVGRPRQWDSVADTPACRGQSGPGGRKRGGQSRAVKHPPSPTGCLELLLQVLPSRVQEGLDIHIHQSPQPEPAQAMPSFVSEGWRVAQHQTPNESRQHARPGESRQCRCIRLSTNQHATC
jgi:hypothetical protein